MHFGWFTNFVVRHPLVVVTVVAIFSGSCIVIPITLSIVKWPSFKDPQLGFSTRGTIIANRLTAWNNLIKDTSLSGGLTSNPKETKEMMNNRFQLKKKTKGTRPTEKLRGKKIKHSHRRPKDKPVYGNVSYSEDKNSSATLAELNRWKNVQNLEPGQKKTLEENYFCGSPDERYAHLVISTKEQRDLFNLADLLSLCRLEYELIGFPIYEELCIQNNYRKCCRTWSLPNFVAYFNMRSSCLSITAEDVENAKRILTQCSKYFHSNDLDSECLPNIPFDCECLRNDAVYNVLNYVTSVSFLPSNETVDSDQVKEVMLFLPLACSTSIIPYYNRISSVTLDYNDLEIFAINFGIKDSLFDIYVVRDTYLMGSGVCFVFICIWVYTQSLFLTLITILIIVLSLGISYFIYDLVFDIRFFPFMNLLATVVAIGIGSDDAFIFCKSWEMQKQDHEAGLEQIMNNTFHHAFMSLFVTTLTTAVAFLGSCISAVTALACFSIFAGMAVITNYFLMITIFPACLVIWERSCVVKGMPNFIKSCTLTLCQKWCFLNVRLNLSSEGWCRHLNIKKYFKTKENYMLSYIIRFKYFWCILFAFLSVASGYVIFVYPKVQLPTTNEFQLFHSSHLFEAYDFKYKDHFWFNHPDKNAEINYKLPLRFVWGVLPIDNGNHLDPTNLGTLTLDPDFDMADAEAQVWLLNFCRKVRQQPFYQSMMGPLLSNCFIETFMNSMNRKCFDAFLEMDRTPCCEVSKFPFNRTVFDGCVEDEVADIYNTPPSLLNQNMAGPKFSKDQNDNKIKALVVEYDSTYSYTMSYDEMDKFYKNVEAWMTEELKTAPKALKNGWFISDLAFYDLQRELNASIEIAVMISMGLALVVIFLSTLNLLTSLYAVITIVSSIFVTIATLVLSGWKLNILEATAISTAIGLTVDFSLHYTVNYCMCPPEIANNREAATKYALNYMAGPAFMAAVTTGAAGAFMLPSKVLPYIQIGMFLLVVMCVSWVYATFMLGSMLAIGGPIKQYGQFSWVTLLSIFTRSRRRERSLPPPTALVEADIHELQSLTVSRGEQSTPPRALKRSMSATAVKYTPDKSLADQSPSAVSAITIIMTDDN
ncbi:unnamed protein product [Phyllotreta striolata]|uniref:SSD domain-containing protein n=1 Tax=Phyllotreta striolata TaxID=444603 RepID=A0A9N9TBJ7_PHYSR|nr:unnamed protein product [Phyllotreta striolata]